MISCIEYCGWIMRDGILHKTGLDNHYGFLLQSTDIKFPWKKEDNDLHSVTEFMNVAFNLGWVRVGSYAASQFGIAFNENFSRKAINTLLDLIDDHINEAVIYVDYYGNK